MDNIISQIEAIKSKFETKKIFDKTSRISLTENELEAIIYIIKNNHKDGDYEINDEIIVSLEKGACHIKDNPND
jgi:hypothetical protein